MNNTEYLKIYLDNIKLGLKHNRNIDAPDEFLNRLLEKYSNYEGTPNDIVEELNVEIEEFIRQEVERKLEEDKVEAEKLAKEETEKLRNEEIALEEEKVKTKVVDEANSAEKEEQAEEEKEEIEINESQEQEEEEQELEEEVAEETEERETQFNNADINMMLIAMASTPEELQEAISKIPNLNARLKDLDLNPEEFENTKRGLFAMYKNGLSDEERKYNGLAFESMDEYKLYAENLGDKFDTVILENGKKVDLDNSFNVEEVKEDIALDTKETIELPEAVTEFDGVVVEDNGNKFEQETRDVVKEEVNLNNEMDIMFNDPEENNMTKEVEEKAPEKNDAKVLKLTPPSEKGFAYSPAINITIMLLLLVFFMIVIITLL